ncbi:MAG: hypothetical protein AB7E72_05715 [Lysobacterales bacterium]
MVKLPIQHQLFMLTMYYPAALFWLVLFGSAVSGHGFWHWSLVPVAMLIALAVTSGSAQRTPSWTFLKIGVIGPAICMSAVWMLQLILGTEGVLPNRSSQPLALVLLGLFASLSWQALRRDQSAGPEARLQRLGRGLSHLARLGQAALMIYALLFLLLLYAAAAGTTGSADKFAALAGATLAPDPVRTTLNWAIALLHAGHGWVVSIAMGSVFAVQLWTLQQLHALGLSLLQAEPLSDHVAARLRGMVYGIVAFVLVDALLPGLLAWPLLGTLHLRFSMASVFLGCCGAICLYAMAILIEEGSRAAAENRAFI